MSREYDQTLAGIERIIHLYNQTDKQKKTYGTEHALSCTEIHVIDEIGKHPDVGVKALAQSKGVTEGAISQLVKKLIGKGLVNKEISGESEARVCLSLTKAGLICFNEHKKYHEQANRRWYELFDELSDAEYRKINSIIRSAAEIMEGGKR